MMHQNSRAFLLLAVTTSALAVACAKPAAPRVSIPNPIGPTVAPPSNVFLRNSFDTDPSRFIGRFIDDSLVAVDEGNSVQRTCSEHIKYSIIDAGGTVREELFQSSTSAAAAVGVPVVAGGDVSGGREAAVLIKYTETKKVVSTIDDAGAFAQCCANSRNQCSSRYISEFIEGTGELFYSVGTEAQIKAAGGYQSVSANLEFKHGMAWQRATRFDKPVYFAFKVSPTGSGASGNVGYCSAVPDWANNVPQGDDLQYFVGVADPINSERESRNIAMQDARVQAVQFIGESIKSGRISQSEVGGNPSALMARFESQAGAESVANGLAQFVSADNWCTMQEPGVDNQKFYKTYVLAKMPSSSYLDAARAVLAEPAAATPATPGPGAPGAPK